MGWPSLNARPLAAQLMRLRGLGLANANGAIVGKGGKLRFDFSAQPYVGGRDYRCRLELERASAGADSYVLDPDLQVLAPNRHLPHIYGHEEGRTELCLYWPKAGEWNPGLWLADTMLPWTIEWLRYFELWLVDYQWHGGGVHPDADPRRRFGVRGKMS